MAEITEEAIRERVRRAVENDCMLLRVVIVLATGNTQPSICIEVPYDATLSALKKAIASHVDIPESRQRIVWIKQTEVFEADAERNLNAIFLTHDDALLRKDAGLNHGDKIHVDDENFGSMAGLAKLAEQINSGSLVVSLSAERRYEVQRGVEAREAELRKILYITHALIRHRATKDLRHGEVVLHRFQRSESAESSVLCKDLVNTTDSANIEDLPSSTTPSRRRSLTSDDLGSYCDLREQARKLESQNEYLDIPYDSIRTLAGKENELGMGKAATVYRGIWMSSNGAAEVAIKLFRYVRLTDKILGDYTQEVALLRKLKHPNIVLFIGACTHPKLMILTEFCSRKSLYEVIHSKNFALITWKYKVRMMLDAARGIQYLHSRRIIHRDIKSHNFLVDDDWRVKVADFGISKVLENDANAFTQCGTTGWVAPEVLLDEDLGYTFKADNWSFAIVMWEMIAGDEYSNPFIGMAPIKFYNQTINQGIRPVVPDKVDDEYAQLIEDCWHSLPAERPPITTIVSRLERMVVNLGASIDLPPTFKKGYHHAVEKDVASQE